MMTESSAECLCPDRAVVGRALLRLITAFVFPLAMLLRVEERDCRRLMHRLSSKEGDIVAPAALATSAVPLLPRLFH
jgi:hypothetical protein